MLVEPYLAGTSVPEVASALADLPHRVLGLGVSREELRRYGTPQEHQAAHGLDAASLRERIAGFIEPRARRRLRGPVTDGGQGRHRPALPRSHGRHPAPVLAALTLL